MPHTAIARALLAALFAVSSAGCGDPGTAADGGADADTDADADADTDVDGDADSDSDSDADSDSDSDGDADAGEDGGASSGPPYDAVGPHDVASEMITGVDPADLLAFRPADDSGAPYPTILFQPGANEIGTSYIDVHSYDLYWQHVASYGFVVFVIDDTNGGPNGTLFTGARDWIEASAASPEGWIAAFVDLDRFYVAGHSNGGINATDLVVDRPDEVDGIIYMASYPNPGILGIMEQDVGAYPGNALFLCGDEDDTSLATVGATNEVAREAYDERFSSAASKTWVLLGGVGHGGFGDYDNPEQPVGTLGREGVTSAVRHFLLSWLLAEAYGDEGAYGNLTDAAAQPEATAEFETTMGTP